MVHQRYDLAGKLWGTGVGPGGPDLITMKAVKVLELVSVVCVPWAFSYVNKSGLQREHCCSLVLGGGIAYPGG